MQPAIHRCRRFVRRLRRRALVLVRSLVVHVVVLALVVLGLLARMSESSDAQVALLRRATALARFDRASQAALPSGARGALPLGMAPGDDVSPEPRGSARFELKASPSMPRAPDGR